MEDELTSEEQAFRSELAMANINPDSFLATDYLNHFNEIVMLLEMAVDMPDLVDEAVEWSPASYVQHFQDSGFVARDLVIEAWGMAAPGVRTRFENIVAQLDSLILSVLDVLKDAAVVDGGFDNQTRATVGGSQAGMQKHLSVLNSIIHNGSEDITTESGDVDDGVDPDDAESASSDAQSQDEIDQLFG